MVLDLPLTYLLDTRLSIDRLHDLEEKIGVSLTNAISEAKLVLGKVNTKQRASFELRRRDLWTEEVVRPASDKALVEGPTSDVYTPKRRRLETMQEKEPFVVESSPQLEYESSRDKKSTGEATGSSTHCQNRIQSSTSLLTSPVELDSTFPARSHKTPPRGDRIEGEGTILVVKLEWFEKSLEVGNLLPLAEYLIYEGRKIPEPKESSLELPLGKSMKRPRTAEEIFLNAAADAPRILSTPFSKGKTLQEHGKNRRETNLTRHTHLAAQNTSMSENEETRLPPLPDYLHTVYSCQRPTPMYTPNDLFLGQLKKIKHIRELKGDGIGVRAYSSAIASIAAYPYTLSSAQEVLRLPRCAEKYGVLFEEWQKDGHCQEADELDTDEQLQVVDSFWNIWGVGATTARHFYNKGWKELADIVDYEWESLTRVQQIGLKYFDEFQLKISRREVEEIGKTILEQANKLQSGFKMCIVGGYRRGKVESGDVDIILSHPREAVTNGFIEDMTAALECSGYLTHTLTLSMANSERGQTPVSWKGNTTVRGSGFDTLDKALVVWQDVIWPTQEKDLAVNPKAKNPNPHRRVDIIVSPWKTFGCAVLGWTSGTTFQRDLRSYCKKTKNLKFDSSGIRSRDDGHWVDFESVGGRAPDYLTAEKRLFRGLGLEWREPELRCTG